jgi:hypothetical protein
MLAAFETMGSKIVRDWCGEVLLACPFSVISGSAGSSVWARSDLAGVAKSGLSGSPARILAMPAFGVPRFIVVSRARWWGCTVLSGFSALFFALFF